MMPVTRWPENYVGHGGREEGGRREENNRITSAVHWFYLGRPRGMARTEEGADSRVISVEGGRAGPLSKVLVGNEVDSTSPSREISLIAPKVPFLLY